MEMLNTIRAARWFIVRVYNRVFIFEIPRFIGMVSLAFNRCLFPGFSVDRGAQVWGRFRVAMYKNSRISVGKNVRIVSDPKRSGLSLFSRCKFMTCSGASLEIGDNVSFHGTVITSRKRIVIGDGTIVAPNVIIVDSDFHRPWPPEERFHPPPPPSPEIDKDVIIGDNVWIGFNTIILKGVTIGDNSVIGAGSVVSKDIPANVVVVGNPARVVRPLKNDNDKTASGENCSVVEA